MHVTIMRSAKNGGQTCSRTGLLCTRMGRSELWEQRLFISGTELSRRMTELIRAAEGVRTMTLPGTVTRIRAHAFDNMSFLKSVVLNDGLTAVEDQAFKNSTL